MEEWRALAGYEGLYEVSSIGRVRRIRFVNRVINKIANPPKILKTPPSKSTGYPKLTLCKNDVRRDVNVHCLVAAAFLGPRPDGMQVAHLNGVRHDNRIENLSYVTPTENESHKIAHGTKVFGEGVGNSTLTEREVRAIRDLNDQHGIPAIDLARAFRVGHHSVLHVLRGETWRHIR